MSETDAFSAREAWGTKHTRVYVEAGRVAHLLAPNVSPNHRGAAALCGFSNWPAYFSGTGSQREHDTALSRPLCRTCERMRGDAS
jgi:hypothetical protein